MPPTGKAGAKAGNSRCRPTGVGEEPGDYVKYSHVSAKDTTGDMEASVSANHWMRAGILRVGGL